jgi:hypothetical protein
VKCYYKWSETEVLHNYWTIIAAYIKLVGPERSDLDSEGELIEARQEAASSPINVNQLGTVFCRRLLIELRFGTR